MTFTEELFGAAGSLYAQVDKKLNGDYLDASLAYKPQLPDPNGNLYAASGLYTDDEGYVHQHSPTGERATELLTVDDSLIELRVFPDPNFTHMPVEINGLPDPYEEYEEHTPSFGEESVESGYSTSNSRGRRVIREIIV